MARESNFFSRLGKLFNTNVVVRKVGKNQLRVIDSGNIQSSGNQYNSKLVDRYTRLHGNSGQTNANPYQPNYNYFSSKTELYTEYEVMDQDPIIASALDIYADECLSGDTKIPLLDGRILTLEELYKLDEKNIWLYGLDSDGTMKPVQASHVACNGIKPVYKLTLEDGTEIKCTSNHIWLNSNQSLVETKDLKIGDGIYGLSTKISGHTNIQGYKNIKDFVNADNHKITNIEFVGEELVYDIVNAGDNHLFAIESNDGTKLYTHNCILRDDFGDILRITSSDENIKKILHNLFYDVLNIEFNLWPWVRNMCKYGDMFLKLDIHEEYGVVNVIPLSSYEMIREEGQDPNNPYHVEFRKIDASNVRFANYEIAHFRLLNDSNFLPYGKSMIEPARKTWKQLTLMEDAMLIHRIMRAPEKRVFKIDIGNVPPNEVDAHMQRIINQMRKVPYIDQKTGEYNLKFNMMNMLEDFFLPVRGNAAGTQIDTLSGMEFTGIDDIEYLKNKMMAALKVPKAFLGFDESISGKATLAAEDVRFARTIERLQRMVISELYKIAIIHLYAQGYENAELINFELTMTSPSTIYEQEKLALYNTKVDLAGSMIDKKLMSRDWIYEHIFNFTPEEVVDLQLGLIDDAKNDYRFSQIEQEGTDPEDQFNQEKEALDSESPEGEESPDQAGEEAEEAPETQEPQQGTDTKTESVDPNLKSRISKYRKKAKVPKGGWKNSGRPTEPIKYGTNRSVNGRDPIGRESWHKARVTSVTELDSSTLKKYGLSSMTSLVTQKDFLTELVNS